MTDTPRLSPSIGWTLLTRSPLHAWHEHRLLGDRPKEPTDAMDNGALIDELLLGGKRIEVVDAKDWRTKAAKEERDRIRDTGGLPVLRHKHDAALAVAESTVERLSDRGIYLSEYDRQAKLRWEADGVKCSGKLDLLRRTDGGADIIDIKVTEKIGTTAAREKAAVNGYNAMQAAAYVEAVETLWPDLAGRVSFRWVMIESAFPCDVVVDERGASMEQIGHLQWTRAKRAWADLVERYGFDAPWPGHSGGILEAPQYALAAEELLA